MAVKQEYKTCPSCKGLGCDVAGYICGDCQGHGVVPERPVPVCDNCGQSDSLVNGLCRECNNNPCEKCGAKEETVDGLCRTCYEMQHREAPKPGYRPADK